MAASTPSEYIEHHLSFFTTKVGDGDFWSINVDTIVMSLIAGVIGLGFLWLATRKATSGVPSKHQAFVEICVGFVNDQVKGIYHGDSKWVAPIAMTVGLWVLLMNSIDFLPIDIMSWFYEHVLHLHKWRPVPTADINTTFALALTVFGLMIGFGIKAKGLGGWTKELFVAPFGNSFWLWPLNFLFQIVEFVSKPLSHSLRLYGNMYAGEILFLLLAMLASAGLGWAGLAAVFNWSWAVFHILIVALQAYIFMMLTIVYLAMAEEHH
jgi:F-type H+-transporting ATPase subunit a